MSKKDVLHRIFAYLKHLLTAWNTTGEGIHSPYLFELVRFILRDENTYYCFTEIERRRELLLANSNTIDVLDFGSAGSPEGTLIPRRVCDIAKSHLESPRVGQVLFRIIAWMGRQQEQPLRILELGASLGITTAYLAMPGSRNYVTTFEGSTEVLCVAKEVWRALRLENVSWVEGNIDDTLFNCTCEKLDFAYVDANHTYKATMNYAQFLLPLMSDKGIIALDDIHYSKEMERAWEELKKDPRVTSSMDLYHIGLLFVDKHYLKRHYRIRI